MELNSIHHLFSKLSFLCSYPLFSTIVTLYTLILLYTPSLFLSIALSPVLNTTGIILISLLRLGTGKLENDSRVLDSSDIERLEKESSCLESSRVVDCKDNDSDLILHSRLPPESKSMESIFLDLVAKNQTHAELDSKSGLELECKDTHVEFEHDMEVESNFIESSEVTEGGPTYEPKSGLDMECNQTNVEFELDMELEPNFIESSQLIEERGPIYELESVLNLECDHTHVDFEHVLGLESIFSESLQAIEEGPKLKTDINQKNTKMAFVEWNVRAPLEIIYEAYEGEEEDDEEESHDNHQVADDKHDVGGIERYPSLLMCYPDSETDSSSDGDFPMNEKWETHESVFFSWEDEEEERGELIEISLDHYGKRNSEFCHVEEDNLIEIDLFN